MEGKLNIGPQSHFKSVKVYKRQEVFLAAGGVIFKYYFSRFRHKS